MLPLVAILDLLPRYKNNCAYGKAGDIKETVHFIYMKGSAIGYTYKDLTEDLIFNTMVTQIGCSASGYRGHASAHLDIYCIDIRDKEVK